MSEGNLISFLAIDLGASSGRAMLGTVNNGRLEMDEIHRFPNPMIEVNGRVYWDLFYLYNQICFRCEKQNLVVTKSSPSASTPGALILCVSALMESRLACLTATAILTHRVHPNVFLPKCPKQRYMKKRAFRS